MSSDDKEVSDDEPLDAGRDEEPSKGSPNPSELDDAAEPKPLDSKLDRSRDVTRLAKHSYLAGFAGTVTVLGMGYLASRRKMLTDGWGIGSGTFDIGRSMAFVLVVCGAVMFLVELGIRFDVDRGKIVKLAPEIKEERYGDFIGKCLLIYGVELGILTLALGFYRTASEYAFGQNGATGYYRPWFAIMETLRDIYLYGGLPYVLLTRALQHAPSSDRKQAALTFVKLGRLAWARFTRPPEPPARSRKAGSPHRSPPSERASLVTPEIRPFDRYDKSALLGLVVKLFFVPLMTVFFSDQFTHLVKNFDYLRGDNITFGIKDFHNVAYTVIFAVDVGLAWCGYAITSRWIKNTLFSTEPTWMGWSVALLCYPPINRTLGVYYGTPGETGFFSIPNPTIVAFFAILSVLSFTVYTSATVMFGLRFSNLTHRGIIQTGPYAIVRHPAYASKNFSWWCVMLPFALYEIYTQKSAGPVLQILGMVIMSTIYYLRAITEERHLGRDPEYQLYMKKVPFRFIPGVL